MYNSSRPRPRVRTQKVQARLDRFEYRADRDWLISSNHSCQWNVKLTFQQFGPKFSCINKNSFPLLKHVSLSEIAVIVVKESRIETKLIL